LTIFSMKKLIIDGTIVLTVALLSPQITQAQGTTYISNLGQYTDGSLAVASDSWVGNVFVVGNNAGGYVLNSIQLQMAAASGNPSGFSVMLYQDYAGPIAYFNGFQIPPDIITTLVGPSNPSTAGIYTYTPPANLTLTKGYIDSIVLTSGTPAADGSYSWSEGIPLYDGLSGWYSADAIAQSSDGGSTWSDSFNYSTYPQFAINATAIPEPGVSSLLGMFILVLCLPMKRPNHSLEPTPVGR
jgi:hypothetical protein